MFFSILLTACMGKNSVVQPKSDGLPMWVDNAYFERDNKSVVCADGRSDNAGIDISSAKAEAEMIAKRAIANQLEIRVQRTLERVNNLFQNKGSTTDSDGKTETSKSINVDNTMKDIQREITDLNIKRMRYETYFSYPNRMNPQIIFVLACVDMSYEDFGNQLKQAVMSEAQKQELDFNHEVAMKKLDDALKLQAESSQ